MTTGDEQTSNLETKYDGYTVYDREGSKIGKVDELFVDDNDREEYIGVKMGLLGLSGTSMIPMQLVRVDDADKSLRVDETKDRIKDAPNYSDEDEIDPAYEDRVLQHFGLSSSGSSADRGSYGRYSDADDGGADRSEAGRSETDRGGSDESREDYEEGSSSATGASTSGASDDREAEGREGGEMQPSGEGGQEMSGGYRDAESGDRGEGMGLTTRRRRVRRRSLREENEEVFEEEETRGRPE